MKTCKLEITHDILGNERFLAYVDSTIIHPTGKRLTTRLDEVSSTDKNDAIDFLVDRGVEKEEVCYALKTMEMNGHNKAGFGMFGGFVSSWFDGMEH